VAGRYFRADTINFSIIATKLINFVEHLPIFSQNVALMSHFFVIHVILNRQNGTHTLLGKGFVEAKIQNKN
jgi:hypothetical protein